MSDTIQTNYLDQLNQPQREAVEYNDGPALVLAGAGSGKTRVLVYKLLHLVNLGYNPSRLMALTFTNKAAREMRSRIAQLIGRDAYKLQMGTFHSIFLRILREHAHLLGYTSDLVIYTTDDTKSKLKKIIKLLNLDDKVYKEGVVHNRISRAKNNLKTAHGYKMDAEQLKLDAKANIPRVYDIYEHYERELKQSNAMDFDDLLLQTNILFRDYPEVLALWRERVDYLLIDEYQDTNFAQYMIARYLMIDKGKIFVVGDDAQSIYSFRGANLENMLRFEQIFKGTRVFKLEQNYRSTQTIVQAAKHVIARNQNQLRKDVFSLGDIGEPIELHEAENGEAEASWVVRTIKNIAFKRKIDYDQFAVLYRTNMQSRLLEQKLLSSGIPFRIWGGRSFFDAKEIKDVLAYFRLMVNERDDEAMYRIINYPKRGIGDTTILKLKQAAMLRKISVMELIREPEAYDLDFNKGTLSKLKNFSLLIDDMREKCREGGDFYKLCEWLINTSGIPTELLLDQTAEGKGRRDNIQEFLSGVDEYARHTLEEGEEPHLAHYLSEISLMTDQDNSADEQEPCVTLMTVHAAKGLEFPHVFIVGLEEQLFPSAMSSEIHELEEERRLFYVAITRAEETCHIGYAKERFRHGKTEFCRPSRFLKELPEDLLKRNAAASDTLRYRENKWGNSRDIADSIPSSFSKQDFMPSSSSPAQRRVFLGRRESDTPEPQHERTGNLRVGGRVAHPRFGEGIIKVLEGQGENIKATVLFDEDGQERKLLLRFANLQALD